MLNRWWAFKTGETERKERERRRPFLASRCNSIVACEKWRLQLLHEIGQKVQDVQNAALGEARVRTLNDEINKLIRIKGHWERRIMELGGPNYLHSTIADDEGHAVEPGGYRYFGAARELAGVKDLFHQPAVEPPKKTRLDLYKLANADYYGFRDDEDGRLEELERVAEQLAVESAVNEWQETVSKRRKTTKDEKDEDEDDEDEKELTDANVFLVPSAQVIEHALVERRKQDLMKKYASQ